MSRFSLSSQPSMRTSHTSSQCHGWLSSNWIYVFILGLSCLLQGSLVEAAFTCPTNINNNSNHNCTCSSFKDANNVKLQNIACVGFGLTAVPADKKEGSDVNSLNLSGNAIAELTESSLVYFTNLVELDLSYNSISNVHSDAFLQLTNLQYLHLEGNDFNVISSALLELESLLYLNLARNNVTFPNEVWPSSALTYLDISYSSISAIPSDLLQNLQKLVEINLSHNIITSLPNNVFKYNTKLQTIDLSHNAISTVESNFIKDASNLVSLDLSHNALKDIHHNAFKKQTFLELVNLSGNLLTTIEQKLFKECENMRHIDLSDNSIETLDSSTFDDVPLLEHLDLSYNDITSITTETFSSISGLVYLDLAHNSLQTLPIDFTDVFTGSIAFNITHNPFDCDCSVRNYLYQVRHNTKVSLFDEDNIKCTELGQQTIFLDWFDDTCSGNLGWQSCSTVYDCNVRNSQCNTTHHCACKDSYYDNNQEDVIGGKCITKVDLGYQCELNVACLKSDSECVGDSTKVCKCKSSFYNTNKDAHLGGECKPQVELGAFCSWDAQCAQNYSECSGNECVCISTHYDSTGDVPEGICLEKLPLNETCLADYQCAPTNSECQDNKCKCSDGFHDMDGTGGCQEAWLVFQPAVYKQTKWSHVRNYYHALLSGHVKLRRNVRLRRNVDDDSDEEADTHSLTSTHQRIKRDSSLSSRALQSYCRKHGIPPAKCGASSFYSCYLDETDGDNKPVEFSELADLSTLTIGCQEYCFKKQKWHITILPDSRGTDKYCLCGSTEGATLTGCCPYSSSSSSCSTTKRHIDEGDIVYVTSGITVKSIPLLTSGVPGKFEANTSLSIIDQIVWNFGDSETNISIDGSLSTVYHTYTYSGKFTASVSACVKADAVCHTVEVTVMVQVPAANLAVYITGYRKADVSQSLTDVTATFEQGYDFYYNWARTDSHGVVTYTKGCENGWHAFRQTCLQLRSQAGKFSDAQLRCRASSIVELNFIEEVGEVISLLSIGSSDSVFINAQRVGGAWEWLSDGSKTFFSDEHLNDATIGDHVVIDGSIGGLTSSAADTSHKTICMKAPVDCPYGGSLHSDGWCYVVSSVTANWETAKADCVNSYNGYLASLKDQSTHIHASNQMTSISDAWFGLNDRQLEGYYQYADESSYDLDSPPYQPTITTLDYDCFVIVDGSTWTTDDCYSVRPYICQYSMQNEKATVPSYLVGSPYIGISGNNNLQQISESAAFTSSGNKELIIFPGMWVTQGGYIRSWNFQSIDVPVGESYELALLVFRPECPSGETFVQPGCDGNPYASCTSSASITCDPTDICSDTQFCYLSSQCKSVSTSCTCASESSNSQAVTACANKNNWNVNVNYHLVGHTFVTVDIAGVNFYTVPVGSMSVKEHDVIGLQVQSGRNPIKYENVVGSNLQQTSYTVSVSNWIGKGEAYPYTSSAVVEEQSYYFQAVYTQDSAHNLTKNLGYSDTTGAFSFNVSVPYSGSMKTLTIDLAESVEDIKWVYPQLALPPSSATSEYLGTLYLESGINYDFTIRVGRGTDIKSTWSFNNSFSVSLQSSCPASVSSLVIDECNTAMIWSPNPFATFSHAVSSTGEEELSIRLNNSISDVTKKLTLKTEMKISGAALSCDTAANNILAVGDSANFSASVTDGTGLSHTYTVDGQSVQGSGDHLQHAFTKAGSFNISVTVSNILGSDFASITITAVVSANFGSCQFVSPPFVAAVGVNFTMTFSCRVDQGAVVSASWYLSDRTGSAPLTSTETATSTSVSWTQSTQFTTTSSSVQVNVTYTDQLQTGFDSTYITVYNAVSTVDLTASVSKALIGTNVTFTATVPSSPGNYGPLTFIFDFGDGTSVTDLSGSVLYAFQAPNTYSVKVTVTNGPSRTEKTIQFEVVEPISALTLEYDGPTKLGNVTAFTARTTNGTGMTYKFTSTEFDITQASNTFSYTYSAEGNYSVSVKATNDLTEETSSVEAIVMDERTIYLSDLTMVGKSFSDCIESKIDQEFTFSVIHFDIKGLEYEWNFDDGTTLTAATNPKHSYLTGNNYTLILTVRYPTYLAQASLSNTVCVQDRIVDPVIIIDKKIGFPPVGTVSKTASMTVSSGTSLVYSWGTNASVVGSSSLSSFSVEFSSTGVFFISANVSNSINFLSVQTVYVEVIETISNLIIDCTHCISKNGDWYVEKGQSFDLSVSVGSGQDLTYTWDFGDGTARSTGSTATKTYSIVSVYNITVEAVNDVDTQRAYKTVYVEEMLTKVTLSQYGSKWEGLYAKISVPIDFRATVQPSGMVVEYIWVFEQNLTSYSTSDSISNHNYTSAGEKTCTVTAKNSLNNVSSIMTFYVLEEVTNVYLQMNGIAVNGNTSDAALNRPYELKISANTDVQVTYTMIMKKGNVLVKNSNTNTLNYTFISESTYTLEAIVKNGLQQQQGGQKTQTFIFNVIQGISDPKISILAGSSSISLGSSIRLTGSATGTLPQFSWSYAQAPVNESVPSNNQVQTIDITPGKVGIYVVQLAVSNAVTSSLTTNYTFEVMQAVGSVSIASSLTPPDAVKNGTTVVFSAVISAGSNLVYKWHVGTITGTQQNFTFQFTVQMMYEIFLNVSNPASSKTESVQIYSLYEVPSFDVAVSGAAFEAAINKNYAKTGEQLNFTCSLTDFTFISLDWLIDSVSTYTAELFPHAFTSAGTYIVMLNASNKISSSRSEISILIQDPIEGLLISNCQATFAVNTDVNLTVTYTKGSSVEVEWEKESLQSSVGTTTIVSYGLPGIYSVNATVSNLVSKKTETCHIIIQEHIANLNLNKSVYHFVRYPVTFSVTGDNLESARYEWTVSGIVSTTTVPTWDKIFQTKGIYTVSVTVSNDVSSETVSTTIEIFELECNETELTIEGSQHRTVLRGRDTTLGVSTSNGGCSAYTSVNKWIIYTAVSCSPTDIVSEYPLPNTTTTNTPTLLIPGKILLYGSYCAVFINTYENTPVEESVNFTLTVTDSPLQALLAGGSEQTIGESTWLLLDASESYDPDETPGTTLAFAWTCTRIKGKKEFCDAVEAVTSSSANLTSQKLKSGDSYTITVTVSAPARISGTASYLLRIEDTGTPELQLTCVSCIANKHYMVVPSKVTAIRGTCLKNCDAITSYKHSVTTASGVAVNIDSTQTSTQLDKANLVLKGGTLSYDVDYIFKFEAYTADGKVGSTSMSLSSSSAPMGGNCQVTPSTVIPLVEKVTVTCSSYTDLDVTSGIYYKIVAVDSVNPENEYIVSFGTNAKTEFYIAPWPGSTAVDVKVYVMNDYDSTTHAITWTVQFSSPSLVNQTFLGFLVEHIQNSMLQIAQENNPPQLIQYIMAVSNLLNEESRIQSADDTELADRIATRDLLAKFLDGLPADTITNIQQLASALQALTMRPEEILTEETQDMIGASIKSLTNEMSGLVLQGQDSSSISPDSILQANKNMYESYQQDPSAATTDADTLFGSSLYNYQLSIKSGTSTVRNNFESAEQRMQRNVEDMLEYSDKAVVTLLSAKLPNEEEVTLNAGDVTILARRVTKENIRKNCNQDGAYLKIPDDFFSHVPYDKEDLFEIISVARNNPLRFSYLDNSPVNTIVASAMFYDPYDNKPIPVSGLPEDSRVLMYMFNSNTNFYTVSDPLTESASYDPLEGVTYQVHRLSAGTTYELTNFEKTTTPRASMHFQLRVEFDQPDDGQLDALLFQDGVQLSSMVITHAMMASGVDHRNFTFYVQTGETTADTSYSVRLTSNTNANVSVGRYNSWCQYYDFDTSSWTTDGCWGLEVSIPDVIACTCDHMTSYGGSVLLLPDQIDFTDLTRLDIPSNPVAIITCSVILGVYIIVAVVCVKLDILDVKRISTIPLCGKDGSFKYEVTVVTGRQVGAGTTANVGCRIIGEYGKSASQHLNKGGSFQRNCSDSFIMAYDVNLGELKKVLIWHDNRGVSPSWYLDHVIIKDLQTDKKYYFFANSWLTLEQDKGTIQKELKAAGSAEMMRFSRRLKTATFNSLADKHLWLSVLNRPAQSRFTRVQRATCCVTLLFTFIAVNAMWYGMLKRNNASFVVGEFGWEEVVLGLISNIMVFPINIGIIFLFKKSRSKANVFEHGRKPQTAETIEIENLCDNSQSGSFQSYGGVPSDLERESTLDSLPQLVATGLHRSRAVKSQRDADDGLGKRSVIATTAASAKGPMWNQDSIMKWPEKMPYSEDADSRPSTSSTTMTNVRQPPGKVGGSNRKASVPGTAESEELLEYLDKIETDLKDAEERSTKTSATRKSTASRKQSMQSSRWGSLEDILNSDDESTVTDSSKKKLKKKSSTTSQASHDKKFNPREEPRINGNGRWLKSRESNSSTTGSMIGGEHFYYNQGHVSSEAGITAGLRPGYHSEMTMESRDIPMIPSHTEKCTLPSWCIYIAYILCFLLCSFSIILVILYCFKFGYEESLEWVVALIFSLFQSVLLIEPVKAVLIAVYMVLVLKKVEQDEDEDCIDIEPTFDSSSEMIKDVKFKPISGFALMQAKEEGRKMHRMKVMLRQFVAYIFYLWLLMVFVYVNFQYSTYLLTRHLENNFVHTENNGYVTFNNISSIEDFWDWTEYTFADSVHLQETQTDEEHGYLLGVARMRLIRSTTVSCEAASSAANLGASSLTARTCYGADTYEEDTASYGEGWNDSSYNYSWKYSWGKDLGSGHKIGHMGTYGGGGYVHNLGISLAQTLSVIQDLKSKSWVDLQTRAVVLEFAIYSPGTDVTALTAMLIEFPLTGGAITSYEIQSQKLLWFQENRVDPLIICEAILLLVTIYSLIHIVISIRDIGKQYFKKFWNWYEMLTTLMTIVAVGMYMGCVVEATNTFNHLLQDKTGFTNFERVMYVHVGMRYLHAWLLFLLMYKVVKQLRFIKFMHIYEKTISKAVGQLLAVGLIFTILLLIYAQVGYLMYGQVSGFESVGNSIVTLIVMIRGTFDFWPMLDYQPIFSHFYVYSYYAFTYGLSIALVIAILNNMYKAHRSQMFFKATLDMQDYEMIEFMLKRFKLWTGIQKEKPAFRRVKFQGLPSISSRSSSSYSHHSSSSSSHNSSSTVGPEYSRAQLDSMITRLNPTWLAVVKRFERIQDLDNEEETLVKKTESEVKELNFRIRVNGLENERRELLNWSKTDKPPGDQKQRQSVGTNSTNKDVKTDRKSVIGASRTTTTPPLKTEGIQTKGKRPLSDQGARGDLPPPGKSSASEPRSLQKFFKQFKPSKPAWNK